MNRDDPNAFGRFLVGGGDKDDSRGLAFNFVEGTRDCLLSVSNFVVTNSSRPSKTSISAEVMASIDVSQGAIWTERTRSS